MASEWCIGIIGGSGLYEIEGLEDAQWIAIETPWGEPSDEILCGTLAGVKVRFLPRHGRGHPISPTELNARANIDARKRAGCTDIVAISAVGSLREELEPGRFALVDQFIDRTFARASTYFTNGFVAHVSMADPTCERLSALCATALPACDGKVAVGATYLAMEGPQFSTRAESRMYRQWGADIIGMTGLPEAKLAREAEWPYATVAMVTDYDCWRADEAHVEVTNVLEIMAANTLKAKQAIGHLAAAMQGVPRTPSPQGIETCLDYAMITAPGVRDPDVLAKLDAVAGRVLGR